MDKVEVFKKNIEWFKSNFGAQHFAKVQTDMIWEELKDFSAPQIDSLFRRIAGESEFAPKVGTFRLWAGTLRERIRQHEREQERADSKAFWEGTLHSSEVKATMDTIKLRMLGRITDEEWVQFMQILGSTGKPPRCHRCDDTGVRFDEKLRSFKCQHGHMVRPHPTPTHAAKSHPEERQ